MAASVVGPMVFLVDFIARGLGAGTYVGSMFWIWYGMGAIVGPPLYGFLADRIGPRPTVRVVVLIQSLVLAGVYVANSQLPSAALTVVIGTFLPRNRTADAGAGTGSNPARCP